MRHKKNNIEIEERLIAVGSFFRKSFNYFYYTQNDPSILLKNLLSKNYILIIQFIMPKFVNSIFLWIIFFLVNRYDLRAWRILRSCSRMN